MTEPILVPGGAAMGALEASRSFETFYDGESRLLFRRLWFVTGNRAEARLPPRQRAALVLTEMLGFTAKEAGDALGVKASTVRSLSRQGRESFRRVMEVDGV